MKIKSLITVLIILSFLGCDGKKTSKNTFPSTPDSTSSSTSDTSAPPGTVTEPPPDTKNVTDTAQPRCINNNFQTVNIGQDIVIDCENNQVSFSFLRDGENLLVKILLNAPERIFGINLEILYNPNVTEFLDYSEGDFLNGGITLVNTNPEDICNKSVILGSSLLGHQTVGKDGVGVVGTLRFKIITEAPAQFRIKNAAVFKRFFDEEPIQRFCMVENFILNF